MRSPSDTHPSDASVRPHSQRLRHVTSSPGAARKSDLSAWWFWTAPLAPLLGVAMVLYHALAAHLLLRSPDRLRSRVVRPPEAALACFAVAYVGGLAVAVATGAAAERVLASSYNLSIWIMGIALLVAVSSPSSGAALIRGFFRALPGLCVATGALVLLSLVAWRLGVRELVISGPFASSTNDLVASSNRVSLVQVDWFQHGATIRTSGYAPYPTALAACIVLLGTMFVSGRAMRLVPRNRALATFVATTFLLGLAITRSRSTVAMAVIVVVVSAAVLAPSAHRRLLGVATAIAVVLAFGYLAKDFSALATSTLESRAGSTATRIELYDRAIALWRESPVLGIGIKPDDGSGYPIGSHSTYVGVLVRTGLVGMALFGSAWGLALLEGVRQVRDAASRPETYAALAGVAVTVFMIGWMATEDLDAPPFVAFLGFASIAISRSLPTLFATQRAAAVAEPELSRVGSRI